MDYKLVLTVDITVIVYTDQGLKEIVFYVNIVFTIESEISVKIV